MKSLLRQVFAIFLFALSTVSLKAQVGIGTFKPDTSSILDIVSPKKGILLPRVDKLSGVDTCKESLLFDNSSGKFKHYHNKQWISVNPLDADENDNVTAKGFLNVTGKFAVNGQSLYAPLADSISARKATVKAKAFEGYGVTPIGGIIMWGGPSNLFIADGTGTGILDGWALCDNQNGRPDLRGKFIAGYSGTGDYTSIGASPKGDDFITLNSDNLPKHSHAVIGNTSDAGAHKHSYSKTPEDGTGYDSGGNRGIGWEAPASTSTDGDHKHPINFTSGNTGGIYTYDSRVNPPKNIPGCTVVIENYYSDGTIKSLNYCDATSQYCNTITSCIDPLHDNSYPDNATIISNEKWTITPFDNRPEFYVLAFIMRIK